MTLAAILIQSRFRSFHEQRKFQQSRRAAVLIQQYYRSYRHSLGYFSLSLTHTHAFLHTYFCKGTQICKCFFSESRVFAHSSLLTKKQNQAARKILRFLLRCRHRWGIKVFDVPLHTHVPRTHNHTHYPHTLIAYCPWCPHYIGANSWCCFTVPVKPLDGP